MKNFGDITLIGSGEIINLVGQRVSTDPDFVATDDGIIIYNTTEKTYKYNNGSSWVAFEVSLTSSTQLVDTLGNNWINPDLSFDPTEFNALTNIDGLTADDSLLEVITALDTAVTAAQTVTTLQGVPLNFDAGDLISGNIVIFNGTNFVPGTVNDLDTVSLNTSDLQDTDTASAQDNDFQVFSGGAWTNKPVFSRFDEFSGTLSVFTVNHALGEQFCHVTVVDRSFSTPRQIDPVEIASIEYNTANTLTVTLTGTKPVTILVSSLEFAS